jgi:hypothetical protein
MSNDIEILVSFDTTGSMYPCLTQVRREVSTFFKQLFQDIPNIKLGVIAHGDYCDEGRNYVIKEHELSTNQSSLENFIKTCGNTDGGDSAECYELVLHKARSFNWTAGKNKVLIVIGDDVPHSPHESQNKKKLDWRNELKCLLEMGIKVYGVQALNRSHATKFYQEIASITGGFHLNLNQFSEVSNLIYAVCYQQQGKDKLSNYQDTLKKNNNLSRGLHYNIGILLGDTEITIKSREAKSYGKTDLESVSPERFQILDVSEDCSIDDFVRDNGLIFKKGKGFYEFTKATDIQSYKEVVIQDRVTGDMFTGKKAREIMGIPVGENARCSPGRYEKKYRAFIQSTSSNRKLIHGTKFLYEVETER